MVAHDGGHARATVNDKDGKPVPAKGKKMEVKANHVVAVKLALLRLE